MMEVFLQMNSTAESLKLRPIEDSFSQALRDMKLPEESIKQMIVEIQFVEELPNEFDRKNNGIYKIFVLQGDLNNKTKLNRSVARELRKLCFALGELGPDIDMSDLEYFMFLETVSFNPLVTPFVL